MNEIVDLAMWLVQDINSPVEKQIYGKALIEKVEALLDANKAELEKVECGVYINHEADKKLVISSAEKSTLNSAKIGAELSVDELRKLYKATESGLKSINRQDLITKYKTMTVVKSFKVLALTDKDKSTVLV